MCGVRLSDHMGATRAARVTRALYLLAGLLSLADLLFLLLGLIMLSCSSASLTEMTTVERHLVLNMNLSLYQRTHEMF